MIWVKIINTCIKSVFFCIKYRFEIGFVVKLCRKPKEKKKEEKENLYCWGFCSYGKIKEVIVEELL